MRNLQREDRKEPDKNIINEDQREKESERDRESKGREREILYILKDEKLK